MKKIEKIILTIIIFSLAFIPLLWFRGNEILIGYDNIYPLNALEFLKDRLFSWTQAQNFGHDQSGVQGSLIIHFIDSIPLFFGASPQLSQKIVFSFWFFLLLFSPYIFIKRLEKYGFVTTKYLRYIFPVLIAFNFYILQAWWVAERTKFSVIIATLLILSILVPLIKKQLTKTSVVLDSFLCAVILTLFNGGGWEGISLYGGFFVFFGCFYIFFAMHAFYTQRKKRILNFTLFAFLFGLWFALLNAYTLLPFILTTLKNYETLYESAGGIEGLVGWTRYLSIDSSFLNLLRLQGIPDLYNNGLGHPYAPYYLGRSVLIFASYFFPIFLLLAFWKKRREHTPIYIFFLFVLLLSLFFTAGIHKPLGFLFEKIMYGVPGFFIFRSAIFKFGYAFWITASFFIGIFISEFIEYAGKRVEKIGYPYFTKAFFFIIFIVFILFYYFPYFKGDIFRINQSGLSSRVEIPKYVSDFSKWWIKNGKEDRILLLPKLNESWIFEQYKWGYLSLFPLLKNFGNYGIVENTDFLLPKEEKIVSRLYKAISDQNYSEQEILTTMLGIRYFLVRNDFYYNFPNQETDNPQILQAKLDKNPNVSILARFGEWSVYGYKRERPIIFSTTNAVASFGSGFDIPKEVGDNFLLINNKFYQDYPQTFSHTVIWPECLSCKAERIEIQVTAPKPKVLFDSYLYEFVRFIDSLKKKDNQTIEGEIFDLVGKGLHYVAQINELILEDKNEDFIREASDEFMEILSKLHDDVPNMIENSANPYVSAVTLSQYIQAFDDYMNDLVSRTNKRNSLIALQKIQFSIEEIRELLRKFYWVDDFNRRKIYRADITSRDSYSMRIKRSDLGFISEKDQLAIKLVVDGKERLVAPKIEGEYVNFGEVEFNEGIHTISILLPPQRNITARTVTQNIAGKSCFSSIFDNFIVENNYDFSFLAKNTSGNYISLFIDDNREPFAPVFVSYFPPGVGRFDKKRVIVARDKMHFETKTNTVRMGFCSSSIIESEYLENIRDLSFTLLTEPEITLYKKEDIVASKNPHIEYSKINPTNYRVTVRGAKDPFYLNFSQRFSEGWEASEGVHFRNNRYSNSWLVERKGDFEIDIYYKPQNYFYIGFIISVITLIIGLVATLIFKKKKL